MRKIVWLTLLMLFAYMLSLSSCKKNEDDESENPHTHEFGEWVSTKNATCTDDGSEERICATCEEKETRNIYMAHSYKNGICENCGKSVLELETGYTLAVPENQGVQNAIERAYLMTDLEWTTLGSVPGLQGNGKVIYFEEGVTHRGIPYSGTTAYDCYVGLNVSIESFLTALKNPNSVLYTENLQSTNTKAATYFGTVCSKFVQYALDVPGSFNTNNVANIPGMTTIALQGKYTVDDIQLGDVVLNVEKHTTICTGIIYDADGKVAFIEISEATYPTVRRKLWSPDEFYVKFKDYRLCRYEYIDSTPTPPTVNMQSEYALMPRFGDKYNYKQSDNAAVVDVLVDGYYKAVTLRDGVIVNETLLDGAKTFTFERNIPGYIEMYLEKEDGTRSGSVYACVVDSSIKVTNSDKLTEGRLTVEFNGSCGTPLYVQVGRAQIIFCNIEGLDGTAELSFSFHDLTSQEVRVAYKNEYGVYLSAWSQFSGAPNTSTDPLLSQADYWNGYTLTPSSHIPTVKEGKTGYWTYSMIPVNENETYYSLGANRMWFLDENGNPIKTYNASKDSAVKYQFTTPQGTAYVSITYGSAVEKGTESIEIVHNYEDGICLGCGKTKPSEQ